MANGFLLRSLDFAAGTPLGAAAGTSAAFLQNDFMGMLLRAGVGDPLVIDVDLGSAQPVDTIAVLGVNRSEVPGWYLLAGPTLASGAVLDTGSQADAGKLTNIRSARRTVLWVNSTPVTARWWRIVIPAVSGFSLEASRVLIGQRIQFARNFSFGLQRGVEDLGEFEFSPRGAQLRRRARVLRTLGLSWSFLETQEAELLAARLMEQLGNTEMVGVSMNPEDSVYQSERFFYGPLEGNISLTWRNHNMWEKRLQMKSVI